MKKRAVPQFKDIEQQADGWLKKYVLTYQHADGREFNYDAVSRKGMEEFRAVLDRDGAPMPWSPDAVCIVPFTEDGKIVLIREYRYPVNSWVIAFPAGLRDGKEDVETCAVRELHEEIGYKLVRREDGTARMKVLRQSGYSSLGMGEENVQTVFALVEKEDAAPEPEDIEFIESFELAKEDVREFLNTNELPLGIRTQLILEMWDNWCMDL